MAVINAYGTVVLTENEFMTNLCNFILFMKLYATNNNRRERTIVDSFATETITYGDSKYFPFSELPTVSNYSQTSSLLGNYKTAQNKEILSISEKKLVRLTYVQQFVEMAFMNSTGTANFIAYMLGQMESAKENYMYKVIISDLFGWTPSVTAKAGTMVKTVPTLVIPTSGVADINATETYNQKKIELAMQNTIDSMSVFTDIFIDIDNGTGDDATNFQTAFELDDLVFIGNAKYLNERVTNLMATLLKSSEIDSNFRMPKTLKIPEISIPAAQNKFIGFIAHKNWYQWFYKFTFMGTFFDASNLFNNNFLHFWYGKGFLKNLPVCKLVAAN